MRDVASRSNVVSVLIARRRSNQLHADRVYVLERGRIVEQRCQQELDAQRGVYYAMWRQ
jgi:ATP-binding cassette, subfamily B, bacterial